MASPRVALRLPERLAARVADAATIEGVTVSRWLRLAITDRLDGAGPAAEAAEKAAVLREARAFLREGDPYADRTALGLVERYVAALETAADRISAAEQRGRARALVEVANGALAPLDGAELEVVFPPAASVPVVAETTSPVRRGFLREALALQRARALLAAPSPAPEPPSAAALLGEARTRELWAQAVGWPGWRRVFCPMHGVVPSAPGDPDRCYLGDRLGRSGDGPEVV